MSDLVPLAQLAHPGELLVRDQSDALHPVKTPKPLSDDEFKRLIIAAYAQFVIEGRVTLDGLAHRASLPAETCRVALCAPEFSQALSYRGVRLDDVRILTTKQDVLLMILNDPYDGLTIGQKLKRAGVSAAQYQAWMKQPAFAEQVHRMAEQLHNRNDEAILQLSRRVSEGDLNAIKFQFEMNGRYNPAQQSNLDMMTLLTKVLESLSRHVKDPATLAAVANDLKGLASEAMLNPNTQGALHAD